MLYSKKKLSNGLYAVVLTVSNRLGVQTTYSAIADTIAKARFQVIVEFNHNTNGGNKL